MSNAATVRCHAAAGNIAKAGGFCKQLSLSQNRRPTCLPPLQGATQPPPRLTERDLIAKMEEYGIGTDATVADHIQKQVGRRVWDGTCFVAPVWASGSQPRRAAANAEGKLLFTWLAELTGCSSHLVYRSNPAQQTLLLPRCCSWSVGMR